MEGKYLMIVAICILVEIRNCASQESPSRSLFSECVSRVDGWYNNLDHPEWGTPGTGLTRKTGAWYEDGVNKPISEGLPNPKEVSDALLKGESPSTSGQSVFFAYFAQHLVDDMVDTRSVTCPNEYMNIKFKVKKNGTRNGETEIMPMYRSRFLSGSGSATNAPRILANDVTAWLDGSVIYGASDSWTQHLRSYRGGRLKEEEGSPGIPAFNRNEIPLYNPTVDEERPPKTRNPEELFSFGNRRGNENPFLISIGILWFRWHNHLADKFAQVNPAWNDQQIFNAARRWTIATFQKIVMYDWLSEITGETMPPYNLTGYNSFLDPGISVEFSTAAMRMGHSLIPSGVVLRDPETCHQVAPLSEKYGASAGEPALRLCNTYFSLQEAIVEHGVDNILLGMAVQRAEDGDRFVVEDLSSFLYGPMKRTRLDMEAVTIQRGRDAGIASYNNARRAYGLRPATTFAEINPDLPTEVTKKLGELYGNDVERVETYVGGMMEKRLHVTGELFTAIIRKQFERTRNSDRFWFENVETSLFTAQEIADIHNITIRHIVHAVTQIGNNTLQPNLFTMQGSRCPHIPVSRSNFTKPCSPNKGIDFFQGYWGKYVGIVILLLLFPTVAYFIMCIIAWKRQRDTIQIKKSLVKTATQKSNKTNNMEGDVFPAFEIEGKNRSRRVLFTLDGTCISLLSLNSAQLRKICVSQFKKSYIFISRNKKRDIFVIRIPKEYDVVLRFSTGEERDRALGHVQNFMQENCIQTEVFEMDESALREEAVTKEARQSLLEAFFRQAFAEVLNLEDNQSKDAKKTRHKTMEIADCELTQTELAETMGMKPDSLFVQQMFQLADTDHSGYLSFREFGDLVILLMNGSPEQKAKMLFDMYDVDHSGELNREEGTNMIRSFLEMAGAKVGANDIDAAVETIFKEAGVGQDKDCLTLEDFTYVMLKEHRDAFECAQLSIPGYTDQTKKKPIKTQNSVTNMNATDSKNELRKRNGAIDKKEIINEETEKRVFVEAAATEEEKTWWGRWWKSTKRYVENYRRHILCMVVFYGITIALMVERAIFYAFGAEHQGIRRVTEWGIIISRSTAAAMSFHYSFILLTMSRNLITFCRETFLKNIIPFDSAVAFHKQIAYVALVETILHTFGHLVNVYHFSVHPLPVLACLFPKIFIDDGSDLPKPVTWWVFETIPGITGVLLLLTIAIMYVFAMQFSRRFCFRAFWITHHLYAIMYVLVIIHGSMAIVQKPVFHFYLVVPAVIFFIDKMITIGRSKVEIKVVKAEALPSGVTNLVFKRPTAFDYKSGQWVKIASLSLGPNEYHPFTLTSAPHERYLSLHIRSVGPWTTNLRNLYQGAIDSRESLPNLYLDGPFGEGHQDWYKHDVAVLVGAGIGVTPFASILKDIVNRTRTDKSFQITCKKVYFVWVTRTQRHFEWLTDIIKELEESEGGDLVSTHIYITQFANKFDLRTTMLYICERYFQKVANKSMFTGLKATTHFGRPQFELFLNSLQTMHSEVRRIGVFSCGPPGLTSGVEDACKQVNKLHKARFSHFYENF